MQYTLTRAEGGDSAADRYPLGQRELVDDPMKQQVHRNVFMGKLEDVLHSAVNWGRKNSLWPYNFGLSCCYVEMTTAFTAPHDVARTAGIERAARALCRWRGLGVWKPGSLAFASSATSGNIGITFAYCFRVGICGGFILIAGYKIEKHASTHQESAQSEGG